MVASVPQQSPLDTGGDAAASQHAWPDAMQAFAVVTVTVVGPAVVVAAAVVFVQTLK